MELIFQEKKTQCAVTTNGLCNDEIHAYAHTRVISALARASFDTHTETRLPLTKIGVHVCQDAHCKTIVLEARMSV